MSELLPKNAKFSLGQIVYHSKFKYRGVIVDADPNFQGTDEWYESVAKSKPDKNKPWYHVLVHIFFYEYDNSGQYSLKQTFN